MAQRLSAEDGPQDLLVNQLETSLVISPNLDALLAHDERRRTGPVLADTPLLADLPQRSLSPSGGLLPPPRKKTRSRPVSPRDSEYNGSRALQSSDYIQSTSSLSALALSNTTAASRLERNPYINTPPRFESFRSVTPEQRREYPRHEHPFASVSPDLSLSLPQSPPTGDGTARYPSIDLTPEDYPYNKPRLPTVEKVKGAFGILSESNYSTPLKSKSDVDKKSDTSPKAETTAGPSFFTRVQKRAKPKRTASSQSPSDMASPFPEVLDIGRRSYDDHGLGNQLRPAIDYQRRPSLPSYNSDTWASPRTSGSSYAPATIISTEPRISVSSTAFAPTMYSTSYQDHEYRSSSPPVVTLNDANSAQDSPSRESFMEFLSPATPKFSKTPGTSSGRLRSQDAYSSLGRDPDTPALPYPATSTGPLPSLKDYSITNHGKPPIPNAPKPVFNRSNSAQGSDGRGISPLRTRASPHRDRNGKSGSNDSIPNAFPPPTTNNLNPQERADLVKRMRKLAQMFGQTPSAQDLNTQSEEPVREAEEKATSPVSKGKGVAHQRAAMSVSATRSTDVLSQAPSELDLYVNANRRRHSAPLSPDDPFFGARVPAAAERTRPSIEIGTVEGVPASDYSSQRSLSSNMLPDSPTSFMDLSDDEGRRDNRNSGSTIDTAHTPRLRKSITSSLTPSISEILTSEEQLEEERRKKRLKLAKMHRFLGSRVPLDLVLGQGDGGLSLPPPASFSSSRLVSTLNTVAEDSDARSNWMKRRRSGSAAIFPTPWSEDRDRQKEDLTDKEKAQNVRRAQKMEKVFGVMPPQTLYHTRQSPSLASPSELSPQRMEPPAPPSPRSDNPSGPATFKTRSRGQVAKLSKGKKYHRPGTADSNQQLIPDNHSGDSLQSDRRASVYSHYEHSLLSLHDIIDRDDKASLAELHQYVHDGSNGPTAETMDDSSASVKSERRRSLPTRSSINSLRSEYSITTPKPEPSEFQVRRRRAAKLTNFFGVDYRDVIQEVLESIERGVEDERKRGTLNAQEAEDLRKQLRTLRVKRGAFT